MSVVRSASERRRNIAAALVLSAALGACSAASSTADMTETTAKNQAMDMAGMDMSSMTTGNVADPNNPMDHSHIPVEVPEDAPVPALSITLSRDWMTGLNLKIHTERYNFIPPPSGLDMAALMTPSVDAQSGFPEGHAHLYVNGEKIQRVYGPDLHLPATLFKPGLNQINVSINNHGHMYWTSGKRQVLATLFINLDLEDMIVHRFESFPALSGNDAMCSTEKTVSAQ